MRNTTADVAERNFRFYFSNSGGRSSVLILINALEILTQTIKKTNPEAKDCAREIINGTGWEVQESTINKNMSEAAAKAWHESVKNNKGIM